MPRKIKRLLVFLLTLVILASIIISGYRYYNYKNRPVYNYVTIERVDLVQEVSVTGRVKPSETVDLAFEKSGKVAEVFIAVGDKVTGSQILARLNNADIVAQARKAEAGIERAKAQLEQYQANLETQKAELAELEQGTRPEEIKLAETKVANAEKALADIQENLKNTLNKADTELAKATQAKVDVETNLANVNLKADTDLASLYSEAEDILNDAYAKADDAVNNRTTGIFLANSNKLSFVTANSSAKSYLEVQETIIKNTLSKFKSLVDNLSSNYADIDKALAEAKGYLTDVKTFLLQVDAVLNAAVNLVETTLNIYRTNIYTGRTNINTAFANINGQENDIAVQKQTNQNNIDIAQAELNTAKTTLTLQEATNQSNNSSAQAKVNEAENNLASARDELVLKKAGATQEQIRAQEALVRQAEANILTQNAEIKQAQANFQDYQAQIEKTLVRAPFSGIVTKQEAKVGEIISASTNLISLISETEFQIEANVPEADMAKVEIGDLSRVTLDAYGEEIIFEAKVISVDPVETIFDGVATYKTTLQFLVNDPLIRSGMTANIDIITEKRENVIAVPSRALISKNGEKVVQIMKDDGRVTEVPITIGIRDSLGMVEIISGLKEGERVVTFVKEKP